jgi:DNA-binding FadR family transcriptional regulator
MPLLDQNFNLSQRMSQELGRQIVCGFYRKTRGLPTEAELCEQFGVSRSAVREAVKMLSAKGLITSKPRQGIRIQPEEQWNIFDSDLLRWALESNPSLEMLREYLQMRIAIEPEAAALAARHATEEQINVIAAAIDQLAAAEGDSEAVLEADIAFHISILYGSNNRFYIRLRDFIQTALRVSFGYTQPLKDNFQGALEDHLKILNAIKNRNPDRAKHSMLLLVDETLGLIEEQIRKQEEPCS